MFGSAADTARLLSTLDLDDSKFQRGVNRSLKSVGRLDKGLGRAGKGFGRLGGGLAKAGLLAGGAVVAGLAASAKAAVDWEDAFTGVVKTVDEADLKASGLTFEDLSNGLRAMAREMPVTHEALAGIAEQAGALGIAGKDILGFTKQVAILASTTDVSAEDAATALGQLGNVMDLSGPSREDAIGDYQRLAAALVDLGNKGASTESQILEIAKRSGGAAKLVGLAKDATLGWSAAAANLGMGQELAGTALQKFYLTAMPKFMAGAKTLQEVTGKTGKQLKQSFQKDAGAALKGLIKALGQLDPEKRAEAAADLFGNTSGLKRLVLGLADSYSRNLVPALDDAEAAWKKGTAAQEEFDKRNATVRSAFTRLKNTIKDAAISIGEGMVPALGRAADKLAAFLAKPANVEQLKNLGRDIGAALDSIEWDKLFGAAKNFTSALRPALDIVLKIADTISKLPPEVIATGGTALLADRVTGGAISGGIGGIVGGLGESLAKAMATHIPVFGKAFVQPVYVTNMLPGGMGGGVGAAAAGAGGATGALGTALKWASRLAIVGIVAEVANEISGPLENLGNDIGEQLGIHRLTGDIGAALGIKAPPVSEWQWPLGPKNTPTILPEVFGGNGLLGGTAKKNLDLPRVLDLNPPGPTVQQKIDAAKAAQVAEIRRTGSTTATNVRGTTSAVGTAQSAITAAIYAARPVITTNVNVTPTSIEKNYTTVNRYGTQNGSAGGGGANGSGSRIDPRS